MARIGKTIFTNSPVGESEYNRRADEAAILVQVGRGTFSARMGTNTKTKLDMQRPFATWLTRWAGEVLTTHSRGQMETRHGKDAGASLAKSQLCP